MSFSFSSISFSFSAFAPISFAVVFLALPFWFVFSSSWARACICVVSFSLAYLTDNMIWLILNPPHTGAEAKRMAFSIAIVALHRRTVLP